jgi:unsaturated rhamnogalacturonyl hydrolase
MELCVMTARVRRGFALLAIISAVGGLLSTVATVPAAAASTRYEAEAATITQGAVESDHAGFTGTGFVNYDNVIGGAVQFAVTVSGAKTTSLNLRFANGTTTNRPMDIFVNGTLVAGARAFAGTGAWTTWQTATVSAALVDGVNTMKAVATTANGGPNLDSLTVGDSAFDWSVAMVESTMARFSPSQIGGWSYPVGLYLYGQYLVYQRTHDPRYLAYIKSWVDRFVDSSGNIGQSFNNLDSMLSGRLLNILHRETGQDRYRIAALKIRNRLNSYPRTADNGFWHALSREHQLWGDGTFMLTPFLAEYGREFGDGTYANNETTQQLVVYASHLQQSNGLLRHAFDEARTQSWADKTTGLAPEYWCRAIGWYGMATIDVLEVIPANHPRRAQLLTILRNLVAGIASVQDPATGRWFQVMDKGSRSDNWTETSCSSMHTFVISRAVERGYVDPSYRAVASRGYAGVLQQISLGSDNRTNLREICIGTNVGSYSFYVGRPRATNDFHGLGAFLIMNEQLMRTTG